AQPGVGAQTESLGQCKIISHPVFMTVVEHNGDARLIGLDDVIEVDRRQPKIATTRGKVYHPRRIDLPDKIYVETSNGYA
ncbi:hypothetical protein ACQ7B2_13005, partial [Escherichia coli]